MLHKLPLSEINPKPSESIFQPVNKDSVRTRLTEQEKKELPTNGHTLETLRDFKDIAKHDKIDQIGIAQKLKSEHASKYAKSQTSQAFYKAMQSVKKPKQNV